jgi:hypothetical protein
MELLNRKSTCKSFISPWHSWFDLCVSYVLREENTFRLIIWDLVVDEAYHSLFLVFEKNVAATVHFLCYFCVWIQFFVRTMHLNPIIPLKISLLEMEYSDMHILWLMPCPLYILEYNRFMYVLLCTGLLCFSCLQNITFCLGYLRFLFDDDCHSPVTILLPFRTIFSLFV